MKVFIIFYNIIFFSSWPIIQYISINLENNIVSNKIYFSLVILTLFSLISFFILRLKLRSITSLSFVCSFILSIFLFGGFVDLYKQLFGENNSAKYSLVTIFIVFIILFFYLKNDKSRYYLKFSLILLILYIYPILNLVSYFVFTYQAANTQFVVKNESNKYIDSKFKIDSNVYFIILDMYARKDVLLNYFDFDNNFFLEHLKNKEFFVADQSFSNFPSTPLTISTSFNMSYYTNSTEIYDVSLIKHSSITHKIFKKNGYDFIFIESGGNSQISCSGKEDLCIKGGYFSDDIALLLQMTPLWRLMRSEYFNLYRYFESFYFLTDLESSINLALDKYKDNSNNFLLFAHILSPHEPKRYNSDCSKFISINPGLGNPTFNQYKIDVSCISLEAIDTIDKILDIDKSDPIIILASDHGVASSIFKNRFPNIDDQEPLLRLKNFSSIKSPDSCTQYLYDNISPANYFKFVFSCLNQEKNEFLEDLYFLNKDEHGVLNNVTNLVNERIYE